MKKIIYIVVGQFDEKHDAVDGDDYLHIFDVCLKENVLATFDLETAEAEKQRILDLIPAHKALVINLAGNFYIAKKQLELDFEYEKHYQQYYENGGNTILSTGETWKVFTKRFKRTVDELMYVIPPAPKYHNAFVEELKFV